MLTYHTGDIFTSKAQVLVNPVNTVGIQGKGLALLFKNRYGLRYFENYRKHCELGSLAIGHPTLYKPTDGKPWVLNFPTKHVVKEESVLYYLDWAFENLCKRNEQGESALKAKGVTSIAFPKLGCGNGGLEWDTVGKLMARYLENLDVDVEIWIGPSDKQWHYVEGAGYLADRSELSRFATRIPVVPAQPKSQPKSEAASIAWYEQQWQPAFLAGGK